MKPQNPFNITLLNPSKEQLKGITPTTRLDIYEGMSNNFHDQGLFSTLIFGRVGSPERDLRFSYIDTKTSILHPVIFQRIIKLKSLYNGIMSGKQFAKWDPKLKDFISSNIEEGETGYSFFISHFHELVIPETDSEQRKMNIQLINKFKDKSLLRYVLVMPAGLRDLYIDQAGRTSEDEINKFYRELLATSNTIVNNDPKDLDPMLDAPRYKLQLSFLKIYEYLENMLSGKSGLIQKKWGSRKIFNGTRNVISGMDTGSALLDSPRSPKITDTQIGLFQFSKAFLPLVIKWIQDYWLTEHIGLSGQSIQLTDPNTLRSSSVILSNESIDKWGTREGLEKIIGSLLDKEVRTRPIKIEDKYLGLVYETDTHFKVFSSLDEIPDGFKYSSEQIKPMTLTHLIYCSGYRKFNEQVGVLTRYPVEGMGSIFPTTLYMKTTLKSKMVYELNEMWEAEDTEERLAIEYPILVDDAFFLETLVPHLGRLQHLGADFDGDTCSLNGLYSEEAKKECLEHLNKLTTFIRPDGSYYFNLDITPIKLTLRNMTA